jgi:hypothetical protein
MSERQPLRATRLLLHGLQIAIATLMAKPSSMPPLPRSGHRHHDQVVAATLFLSPPPNTASTTMTTLTSAISTSKGYHLYVVLTGFYSSHSIRTITMLQLRGDVSSSDSTFSLFTSLTVSVLLL